MPRDRKTEKTSESLPNSPKTNPRLYEKTKNEYIFKTQPDKIAERMDNPRKSQQNVIHNIKSFMLDKLLNYSAKKTPSKKKLKNKLEVKHKPLSNMPVFPNFPQKVKKEKKSTGTLKSLQISPQIRQLKENPNLEENPRIMNSFIPLKQSNNLLPEKHSLFENMFTDAENEKFEFGFKMFPQENFDSITKQTGNTNNSIALPTFPSSPFEIQTTKSPHPKASISTIPTSRPTFAPMFSITPFVVSFDDQDVGGGQVRRNFRVSTPPPTSTTRKMDYEIFKEYFPEIEIKKINS